MWDFTKILHAFWACLGAFTPTDVTTHQDLFWYLLNSKEGRFNFLVYWFRNMAVWTCSLIHVLSLFTLKRSKIHFDIVSFIVGSDKVQTTLVMFNTAFYTANWPVLCLISSKGMKKHFMYSYTILLLAYTRLKECVPPPAGVANCQAPVLSCG